VEFKIKFNLWCVIFEEVLTNEVFNDSEKGSGGDDSRVV
jgi:hypothetical protein